MYISVESYEEMYLKEKEESEVSSEVEKLRREIAKLKKKMEAPSYIYEEKSFPNDIDVIGIYRSYLARATLKLSELRGGVSVLTEEERSAALFNSLTRDIACLTLTLGRHFQHKYELILDGKACVREIHLGGRTATREIDAESCISDIISLGLGEWKREYLPEQYGCTLSEPTKWQLRIDYKGGIAPRFFDGLGIFPYNFDRLLKLLGAEDALY